MAEEKWAVEIEELRSSWRRWRSKFTIVILRSSCAFREGAAVGEASIWVAMEGGTSGGYR